MKERSSSRSSRPLALLVAAGRRVDRRERGGPGVWRERWGPEGPAVDPRHGAEASSSASTRTATDASRRRKPATRRSTTPSSRSTTSTRARGSTGDEFTLLYRDLLTRARSRRSGRSPVGGRAGSSCDAAPPRMRSARRSRPTRRRGKRGPAPPRRSPPPRVIAGAGPAAAPVKAKPAPVAGQTPRRPGRPPPRPPAPLL